MVAVTVKLTSCSDDIMNYVLERVPPPQPGLPRPRFSLYLSSQLQYGVVVVYHRQCAILLGENFSLRLVWAWCWVHRLMTLTLPSSRGTSHCLEPAGEKEGFPENWHGWHQQVRTRDSVFYTSESFYKHKVTPVPLLLSSRQPLVLPDVLAQLEETEGALDPLFGVMDMQPLMPSPSALTEVRHPQVRSENEHSASTCKWRSSCKSSKINEVV